MSSGDEVRLKMVRRKFVEKAMEAAFDNDLDTVLEAFADAEKQKAPLPIDPPPPREGSKMEKEDSLLGEAACGNAIDVMRWCVDRGASVHHVGKHNRTPLQRAINNDAEAAVQFLLEQGADPRLLLPQEREEPSEEHPTGRILFREWNPADIDGLPCGAGTKKILKSWDINRTLAMLSSASAAKSAATEQHKQEAAAAAEASAEGLGRLKAEYDEAVKANRAAIERRESRIREYDTLKCEGKPEAALAVLLDLVKQAEKQADECHAALLRIEATYRAARRDNFIAQAKASGEDPDARYDMTLTLSGLEDILAPAKPAGSGDSEEGGAKVPLIIDRTGNALTFLTYRSVSIIDLLNSHHMRPDQLRRSIVGALRYGKVLIVNMRNRIFAEAFMTLKEKVDAVDASLFDALLKCRARDPSVYKPLITEKLVEDHPDFAANKFVPHDTARFQFALLTHEEQPQDWEVVRLFRSILIES